MRRGQAIEIEELDAVVAGVVIGADEDRLAGNDQASRGQPLANARIVQHLAKARALGPPRPPPQAPQS